MISAAAVACEGTMPITGAKKRNGMKSEPATTATQPVRPPPATPAPDSMYVVADEVDEEPPADVRHVAVLVEVAGGLADADERPHRVEEVGEEEREHPHDRGDDSELRERVEVEVAEERPVAPAGDVMPARERRGRRAERLVPRGVVDDSRDDGRPDDADEQVALEAPRPQREGQDDPD